jgi:hypothetical protein
MVFIRTHKWYRLSTRFVWFAGLKPPKYERVETQQPLDFLEKVRIARQLWPEVSLFVRYLQCHCAKMICT